MFGFLIFIIVERNVLYNSLYILTERSLTHLCSIRAWVPMSVLLSLSLSHCLSLASSLELVLTLLPGLLRPSRKGTLCLHPLERMPGVFVSDASPVSRALLVLCVKQGISASFSLSLSYHRLWTTRFQSIKEPQQATKHIHYRNFEKYTRL